MAIRVLYFASLKERIGRAEELLEAQAICTVHDVWQRATGLSLDGPILVAVNQQYATFTTPVHDGDEVAFFPPVTGGSA